MAFRVNYNQQRNERKRAKEAKKAERLARRDADAQKRKAEREGVAAEGDTTEAIDTASIPDAPGGDE